MAEKYTTTTDNLIVKIVTKIGDEIQMLQLATAFARTGGVGSARRSRRGIDPPKRWTYTKESDRGKRKRGYSKLLETFQGEDFYALDIETIVPMKYGVGFTWVEPPSQ